MRMIVIAVGLLTLGIAGIGLVQPERLVSNVRELCQKSAALYVAVGLRAVLGIALIIVAPASRFPDVFYILGLITVGAAVVALMLGADRLRRIIEWWVNRTEPFIRVWALVAAAFGAFLIYGVV